MMTREQALEEAKRLQGLGHYTAVALVFIRFWERIAEIINWQVVEEGNLPPKATSEGWYEFWLPSDVDKGKLRKGEIMESRMYEVKITSKRLVKAECQTDAILAVLKGLEMDVRFIGSSEVEVSEVTPTTAESTLTI